MGYRCGERSLDDRRGQEEVLVGRIASWPSALPGSVAELEEEVEEEEEEEGLRVA